MNLLIVLCHHTLILQLGAAHSFNKKSVDKHFSLQLLQFFFSFCRFGAPSVQRGAANGGRFIIKVIEGPTRIDIAVLKLIKVPAFLFFPH